MAQGLSQVAALRGGWAAWQQAGYPLEGRAVAPATAAAAAWAAGGGLAALGDEEAPVTIVEFSDFQCPYCRQHALQTLPQIQEAYIDSGQVRYLFKDYPLPAHTNAPKAAEAARCAGVQGAYWPMHARLFEEQSTWSSQYAERAAETFTTLAKELELDADAFVECLTSGQFAAQVARDMEEGAQAGVWGTPSFLINGQLLAGAYPFEEFQRLIETELQR
jgi:protein-disulfide isomerase